MIPITSSILLDERKLEIKFVRASGPGGQNVNKVATAVQLRFDVARSGALPDDVRDRLVRLASGRMTNQGFLLIEASRFRTQERNRTDAIERLVQLIRQAAERPRPRRKTGATPAARRRRLESKQHRSRTKRSRRQLGLED